MHAKNDRNVNSNFESMSPRVHESTGPRVHESTSPVLVLYYAKSRRFSNRAGRHVTKYDLRGSCTSLQLPQPKTEKLKKSFPYDGAKLWNSLPADVRNSDTLTIFKERIRAHTVQ